MFLRKVSEAEKKYYVTRLEETLNSAHTVPSSLDKLITQNKQNVLISAVEQESKAEHCPKSPIKSYEQIE
jgi:hypothetical protein